jgi:hypothetical protein
MPWYCRNIKRRASHLPLKIFFTSPNLTEPFGMQSNTLFLLLNCALKIMPSVSTPDKVRQKPGLQVAKGMLHSSLSLLGDSLRLYTFPNLAGLCQSPLLVLMTPRLPI